MINVYGNIKLNCYFIGVVIVYYLLLLKMGNQNGNQNENIIIPHEIINIILQQIPQDKIYCSYVSTSWDKTCKYNYELNKNVNIMPLTCAYDLNLWLKEFSDKIPKYYFHVDGRPVIKYYPLENDTDINTLNVVMQYAMNNGYLYGTYYDINTLRGWYDTLKLTKILPIISFDNLLLERKKYTDPIRFRISSIWNNYNKLNVLNKYVKFLIKFAIAYRYYTHNDLIEMSTKNNSPIIATYITTQKNEL